MNVDYAKILLLYPIMQLAQSPDYFDIQRLKDDYPKYKRKFFSCVIDMIDELDIDDENRLNYIAENILGPIKFSNKRDVTDFLEQELTKENLDMRFLSLGFRSIYFLLDDNINQITVEYIRSINKKLYPFFVLFKNKELLLEGYGITPD